MQKDRRQGSSHPVRRDGLVNAFEECALLVYLREAGNWKKQQRESNDSTD